MQAVKSSLFENRRPSLPQRGSVPVVAVMLGTLLLGSACGALGAVKTWNGGGTDAYWQTGGNWSGGAAPVPPNDSLVFTGSVGVNNTNNWTSGKIFTGITFDSGAAAFTLSSVSGGTVTLTGYGITNNSPNPQIVNCPLRANGTVSLVANSNSLAIGGPIATTSGTGTLVVQGTRDVNVSGVISINGGVSVQCAGTGALILSGTNSYMADTVISSGTLKLGASGVIPDGGPAGNVVFSPSAGTATLDVAGQVETINALASSGAGLSVVDNNMGSGWLTVGANGASDVFAGVIRNSVGALALTKVGAGAQTLSGACTYSGPTTVAAGALVLGSAWSGSGPVSVNDGASLGAQPAAPGATVTISSLALGNVSGGNVTNRFLLGALPNPTVPVQQVTGTVTVNGNAFVSVSGSALTAGVPFPVIQFGGLAGSGSFKLGLLPAGFSGTLTTNHLAKTIELTLSDGPVPVVTNTRPNILLIMGDQWRGSSLSFGPNHDADVRTPNLETLASQGIRFDRCYATYPLCTPNRATLITGRYPIQTGMMDNDLMLPPDIPCLADVFRDAGYATYYCGKYHIDGGASPGYVPKMPSDWRRRGYTRFEGFNRGHDYYEASEIFNDNGQVIPVPTNNPNGTFDEKYLANYEPHRETDLVSAFIRTNAANPWLVQLSWGPPHSPYNPPAVFDTYVAANLTERANNPTRQGMSSLAGSYGSCEALDYEVGRLMTLIDELGLASRTLIVFTSDHGDMLGSHGLSTKNKPEDESFRVPLILRWAGKIPAGQTNDFLIATVDLMPTLLKLAGLEVPAGTAGKDKSPVALGTSMVETPVFGMSSVGWRSVVKRSGGKLYKLVMEDVPPYQPTKFWNLSDDPYELSNLTNQAAHAAVQAELQQELLAWQQAVGDPWPAQPNVLAKTSYPSVPTNVQPTTIQLQRQDDGSWMARVPSQSGVTFSLQENPALGPAGWNSVGEAKSGNGNLLNFPLSIDPVQTNRYFRALQSW